MPLCNSFGRQSRCSRIASDRSVSFQQSLHKFGPSNSQKWRQVALIWSPSVLSHKILLLAFTRALGTRLKILFVFFRKPGSTFGKLSGEPVSRRNLGWWNIHSGSATGSFKVITRNSINGFMVAWAPWNCLDSWTRGLRKVTIILFVSSFYNVNCNFFFKHWTPSSSSSWLQILQL